MSTIVLWFLMSYGWVKGKFGALDAEQLNSSILASIGKVIASNLCTAWMEPEW